MPRKSSQIALGGAFSALCFVLMLLTGVIPFAMFALPALAGAMLIAVVVEVGARVAMMVYVSVSLLSAFIIADRMAAILFIFFLGYYPILKAKIECIGPRLLEMAVKFAVFNLSAVIAYQIAMSMFGAREALEQTGVFGRFGPLIILVFGNVVFFIYDVALTRYASIYTHRLRKRILRK